MGSRHAAWQQLRAARAPEGQAFGAACRAAARGSGAGCCGRAVNERDVASESLLCKSKHILQARNVAQYDRVEQGHEWSSAGPILRPSRRWPQQARHEPRPIYLLGGSASIAAPSPSLCIHLKQLSELRSSHDGVGSAAARELSLSSRCSCCRTGRSNIRSDAGPTSEPRRPAVLH